MSAEPLTRDQIHAAAAFVRKVIFCPWRAGAAGPKAYDCWGLARVAQHELAGRDLPIVNADPDDLHQVVRILAESREQMRADWHEVPVPRHLDLVLMSHSRHAHHIGTWLALDGGRVLHTVKQFRKDGSPAPDKPATSFDGVTGLRIQGWSRLQFMRYALEGLA